jgi:hypothetical protein
VTSEKATEATTDEQSEQAKPTAFVVYRGGKTRRWDVRRGPEKDAEIVPGGDEFTSKKDAETFASKV